MAHEKFSVSLNAVNQIKTSRLTLLRAQQLIKFALEEVSENGARDKVKRLHNSLLREVPSRENDSAL